MKRQMCIQSNAKRYSLLSANVSGVYGALFERTKLVKQVHVLAGAHLVELDPIRHENVENDELYHKRKP